MDHKIVIKIAGQAGQGIQMITSILLKVLLREGYELFCNQDFMSRVRGGHNFNIIRFGLKPLYGTVEKSHIIVALDKKTVEDYKKEPDNQAYLIYDPQISAVDSSDNHYVPVPFTKLAEKNGNPAFLNSVAIGAVSAFLNLPFNKVEEVFSQQFQKKSPEILEQNINSAKSGSDHIINGHYDKKILIKKPAKRSNRLLLNGSDAIGLGAILGGCRFIAAYPMSPSTSVFTFLTQRAHTCGIVSEQAEDEIGAVHMALGASSAGVRAMTTTSGGGMALMAEGISFAGVAELPLVIMNAQRPGPATGLPTRTAQEDLEFTLSIGHGEFPRIIFSPGTAEEAFYTTIHAFNLAEKYQTPVFILMDQHLLDSYINVDKLDPDSVRFESYLLKNKDIKDKYMRYQFTDSGVSPMARYMQGKFHFITDSHEHTEDGHITEDKNVRMQMVEKRFKKLTGISNEFGKPTYYGPKEAKTLFLVWGSTYGAAREAVDMLNVKIQENALILFNRLFPFPAGSITNLIKRAKRIVTVEGNYLGQFGRLLKRETGVKIDQEILRYDGRPISANYIIERYIQQ